MTVSGHWHRDGDATMIIIMTRRFDSMESRPGGPWSHWQGGVKVIPKMFNISNPPTVVIDASDSQLHQEYTIGLGKRILQHFPSPSHNS
jgi:hypothetical protein